MRNGTQNLVHACQALYQLRYIPSLSCDSQGSFPNETKTPGNLFFSGARDNRARLPILTPMGSACRNLPWLHGSALPPQAWLIPVLVSSIRKHSISHTTGSQKYVLTEQQTYVTSKESCFHRAKKGDKAQSHLSSEPTFR